MKGGEGEMKVNLSPAIRLFIGMVEGRETKVAVFGFKTHSSGEGGFLVVIIYFHRILYCYLTDKPFLS
jgi:hypothetical protein